MTESEFSKSGCDNKHYKLTMANGSEKYGVVANFFKKNPSEYHLIKSQDLNAFKYHEAKNDEAEMQKLSTRIDLKDIVKAERIN